MASKPTACWRTRRYPPEDSPRSKKSHCGRSLLHCDWPKRSFPSQVMAKCCSETSSDHSLKKQTLNTGEPPVSRPGQYLKTEPNVIQNLYKDTNSFKSFVICPFPGKNILKYLTLQVAGLGNGLNTYSDLSKTRRSLCLLLANHLTPALMV